MSRVIITGANGYVGSHFANHLRRLDYTIVEMGRHPSVDGQLEFIPYALGESIPGLPSAEALIHCAYDFSRASKKESQRKNVQGSIELLSAAHNAGVNKIVFISSMSAYPEAKSEYGKAKYAVEEFVKSIGGFIIRPGLIYGDNAAGIVGAMTKVVAKNKILPLIGLGEQPLYTCHIEDLRYLVEQVLRSDTSLPKNTIVAATNKAITLKTVLSVLGKDKKLFFIPVPYQMVLLGLRLAESLNINLSLRSDSLIGLQYPNKNPDFSALENYNVVFRDFQ